MYALLTPSDTRPVKQFIKPTNCPVVGMHFIFIRTHPTHQPMLYSWYSWHCYTVSSWVVVVQAVNLTVKLFTGSPHATRLLWSEYKKPGQHRSVVPTTRYWPVSAVQQGLLSQAKTKILADNCKWILLHAVQCGGGCVSPAVCSSGSLESGHNLTFLQISEEALWPTRT